MSESTTQPAAEATKGKHTPGAFIWHELRTTAITEAQAFYAALFGWTFVKSDQPHVTYYLIKLDGRDIGGFFDSTGHEMPSHWGGLISVPDVDATAAAAVAAGGEQCGEANDIPGVGRFAMINDPQGANVGVYHTLHGDPDTSNAAIGEFCWDGLFTTDLQGAAAFYEKVIGWKPEFLAPEMGVFKYGDKMEADFSPVPAGAPPHWLTYVLVADLAQATEKARSLGANVLVANQDAGGFGSYSIIQDPIGAYIGLFQGNQG